MSLDIFQSIRTSNFVLVLGLGFSNACHRNSKKVTELSAFHGTLSPWSVDLEYESYPYPLVKVRYLNHETGEMGSRTGVIEMRRRINPFLGEE